jgi:hypothetical protein
MSQMDIKRKRCDSRTWEKYLFLDIFTANINTLVPSLYQYVKTRSIEVFWLLSQPLPLLRFNLFVISETFITKVAISRPRCKTLYAINTSQSKRETFIYEYPLHWVRQQKTHNSSLIFRNTLFKHCRHFGYWNKPLNMRMRVCYLDYHETGLCCYLVIHIENLLRPLQLFYFHLWHVY